MSFNQYEIANAIEKILGYNIPRPGEANLDDKSLNRAKIECLMHLNRQIACIESITPEILRRKLTLAKG